MAATDCQGTTGNNPINSLSLRLLQTAELHVKAPQHNRCVLLPSGMTEHADAVAKKNFGEPERRVLRSVELEEEKTEEETTMASRMRCLLAGGLGRRYLQATQSLRSPIARSRNALQIPTPGEHRVATTSSPATARSPTSTPRMSTSCRWPGRSRPVPCVATKASQS